MVLQNSYYFTSKNEIKPQPREVAHGFALIILHQRTKSNHNTSFWHSIVILLFYIKERNQTTTTLVRIRSSIGLFYIKERNQTTTTVHATLL